MTSHDDTRLAPAPAHTTHTHIPHGLRPNVHTQFYVAHRTHSHVAGRREPARPASRQVGRTALCAEALLHVTVSRQIYLSALCEMGTTAPAGVEGVGRAW
eukprot:scaffold18267_cov146-Isochrysis_galbana.AAC.4